MAENSTTKRKLIFVWNYTNWGGAQIYLLAIMKEAAAEWDILVLLPPGSSPDMVGFLEQIGVRYEFLDAEIDQNEAHSLTRKLQRQIRRIRAEFRTLLRLGKFDLRSSIVHIELAPWQSWLFYTALRLKGANVFVTMHNMLPPRPAWRVAIWKARLQFVSRLRGFHIFASNHDTRNKLKGWVSPKFWENIKVTYTCVNPEQITAAAELDFDRFRELARLGIPPADCIVLCLAQFIDRKGRWVFLESARIVVRSVPEIAFVWVAPELPSSEDQKKIDEYGLGDRFTLVLSRDVGNTRIEILSIFRIGDIFVLPSFVEGLPISLLEAMAMGLPAISTNVYAIPEAVIHDKTGILVEAGDPEALAQAIIELSNDPDRRKRLSDAGRRFVLENFDERVASRIAIEEYRKCFE